MNALYKLSQISKQGHYQAIKRQEHWESQSLLYLGVIQDIRVNHPGMGLRSIYEMVQPEGIGRDAFIELGVRHGFQLEPVRAPHRTTYSIPTSRYKNLLADKVVTNINQVWVSDLTYYMLKEGFYYIVLIMDVYSRRIIGYSAADNMRTINNLKALRMALNLRNVAHYHKNLIHHSDRGGQYISDAYTGLLDNRGIEISMCANVLENAHCERINGTIKNQYLKPWGVKTPGELLKRIGLAVENYNNRPHRSLKRFTPNRFEHLLPSLPEEKRPPLNIFTYQKDLPTGTQHHLFKP